MQEHNIVLIATKAPMHQLNGIFRHSVLAKGQDFHIENTLESYLYYILHDFI